MSQEVYGFKTGLLGGGGSLVFNRFTGPGRVGLQSAYFHPPGAETGAGGGQGTLRPAGGLLGGHRRRPARQLSWARSGHVTPRHRDYLADRTRFPPGSSARSRSAATSCWPTSPASAPDGSARRRSCWSRRSPIPAATRRRDPDLAAPARGCATSAEAGGVHPARRPARLSCGCPATGSRWSATGLRTKISVVNPATGAIAAQIPDKHPGRLFGGGVSARQACWRTLRALPPAGPPPDLQSPEQLHQILLALALSDESLGGAQAAELADRALPLVKADRRSIRAALRSRPPSKAPRSPGPRSGLRRRT